MPTDEEITLLALTKTEMTRLRKIILASDYGDAKPILARAVERGLAFAVTAKMTTERSKKAAAG